VHRPESNQKQHEARNRRAWHSQQTGAVQTSEFSKGKGMSAPGNACRYSLDRQQRARVASITLTLFKGHSQFPVGTSKKACGMHEEHFSLQQAHLYRCNSNVREPNGTRTLFSWSSYGSIVDSRTVRNKPSPFPDVTAIAQHLQSVSISEGPKGWSIISMQKTTLSPE
jgi:hypothetical protein